MPRTPATTSAPKREHLDPDEHRLLALLVTGLANGAIADALFVSENTIRSHLKAVFRKLGVSNCSPAVARAVTDPTFDIRP